MTNTFKFLTALTTLFIMSSFTFKSPVQISGTYGVPASDPSQITLVFNPDNTFYYQDFSSPDKKIAVHGHWTLKGNKVILENQDTHEKFHRVWTLVENGQVAKSRQGMTFYRLCKIEG